MHKKLNRAVPKKSRGASLKQELASSITRQENVHTPFVMASSSDTATPPLQARRLPMIHFGLRDGIRWTRSRSYLITWRSLFCDFVNHEVIISNAPNDQNGHRGHPILWTLKSTQLVEWDASSGPSLALRQGSFFFDAFDVWITSVA